VVKKNNTKLIVFSILGTVIVLIAILLVMARSYIIKNKESKSTDEVREIITIENPSIDTVSPDKVVIVNADGSTREIVVNKDDTTNSPFIYDNSQVVSFTTDNQIIASTQQTGASTLFPVTAPSCTPQAYLTNVWVRTKGRTDISDNGNSRAIGILVNTAQCEATYYVEAGMPQAKRPLPLALQPFKGTQKGFRSSCDSNLHYAGARVNLKPHGQTGDRIAFELYPQNYGLNSDGIYTLTVGVYAGGESHRLGCTKKSDGTPSGAVNLATSRPADVAISSKYTNTQIETSWEEFTAR